MQNIANEQYLTREEAAAFLGVSTHALANWAKDKKGPPFYKPGRESLYKESDLRAYIESTKQG